MEFYFHNKMCFTRLWGVSKRLSVVNRWVFVRKISIFKMLYHFSLTSANFQFLVN